MSGSLVHVTLAEQALHAADIPREIALELERNIHDYRLGSVLVDLPFLDRLWISGLRSMVGLDVLFGAWGILLHMRSPVSLALALLDRAEGAPGRALALGFLTHMAVDVVFHPEILTLVNNQADGSASLAAEHKRIEDQMDLHVLYHFLDHSGLGTAWARRMLALKPDPSWSRHAVAAITDVHGNAPDERSLKGWIKKLAWFGLLSSTGKVPWVTTIPEDDPELRETSTKLANESIRLSCKYMATGLSYLQGRLDRAGFSSSIPDLSMSNGRPAYPVRRVQRTCE